MQLTYATDPISYIQQQVNIIIINVCVYHVTKPMFYLKLFFVLFSPKTDKI